jgi:hypothetical protein
MPIKIKSNSGSVTLDAHDVSGDQTLIVPSLAGGKTLLTTDGDGSSLTGVGVDGIVSTANATAITIDSSENVSVGGTPASLYSGYSSLQIGGNATIFGQTAAGGDKNMWLSQNSRAGTDGSEKAITTGTSSQVMMANGEVVLKVAPSATADANVSWTTGLTVKNDGKIAIGHGFSAESALHIQGDSPILTISDSNADSDCGVWLREHPAHGLPTDASGKYGVYLRYVASQNTFDIESHSNTNVKRTLRIERDSGHMYYNNFTGSGANNGILFEYGGQTHFQQDTTANRGIIAFYNPNGGVGSIKTSGSSTSYATSSDYRLKENLVPLTDSIERVKALNVYRFNFIPDPTVTVDGFLAHEVAESGACPEAVSGEKDAMKMEEYEITPPILDENGVEVEPAVMGERESESIDPQQIDQSKLVPLLTAALQAAIKRIEALENA